MVFCDLYLKRCNLTNGLISQTFEITLCYKLFCCVNSVLEFKSFSPPMNTYTEYKTPNEMHPQVIKRELSMNKMRCRTDFVTKFSWVLCPFQALCNLFSTNHSSESSSFNQVIH